jgi:hypothetical protein
MGIAAGLSPMRNNQQTVDDRDVRFENFAAELTGVVYPLVLRRGLRGSWLKAELGLWRALADTVKKWARRRPPAVLRQGLKAWREGLLLDLTESAFHIAVTNGIKGSLLELELCLYRAFRLVIRRRSRAGKSQ